MGADIHQFLEKRTGKKWERVDYDFDEARNYGLFNTLAGVRGYGEGQIKELEDIPDDISDGVKKEYLHWLGDGHSHTYYTLTEVLEKDTLSTIDKASPPHGYGKVFGEEIRDIKDNLYNYFDKQQKLNEILEDKSYKVSTDDLRIVMWFDN